MKRKLNKNVKKMSFTAAVLLISGAAIYGFSLILEIPYNNEVSSSKSDKRSHFPFIESSANESPSNENNDWELILVNKTHSIPENYHPDLMEINGGKQIDSRIYPYLQRMFDDMRSEGVYPIVVEGYRTAQEQQQMMNDKINAFTYEGYSYDDAVNAAALAVAEVGKSEHQLGLAVDINADETYSTHPEVYEWLANNAYKYGFILRYPADKVNLTGIEYEPWHYRFVGLQAAEDIYYKNICLEEYVSNT